MTLKLPVAAFVIGIAVSLVIGLIAGRALLQSAISGVAIGTGLAIGFYMFADN